MWTSWRFGPNYSLEITMFEDKPLEGCIWRRCIYQNGEMVMVGVIKSNLRVEIQCSCNFLSLAAARLPGRPLALRDGTSWLARTEIRSRGKHNVQPKYDTDHFIFTFFFPRPLKETYWSSIITHAPSVLTKSIQSRNRRWKTSGGTHPESRGLANKHPRCSCSVFQRDNGTY